MIRFIDQSLDVGLSRQLCLPYHEFRCAFWIDPGWSSQRLTGRSGNSVSDLRRNVQRLLAMDGYAPDLPGP